MQKKVELQNPRIASDGTITWDCVWFGRYPQSSDGNGGFNNDPIKWRVLSVEGNEALLLADKNLDGGIPYHESFEDIAWGNCALRNWLNYCFLNQAFNIDEQKAILEKMIQNDDNLWYGSKGGRDTRDKVFLLSLDEIMNPTYGFPNNIDNAKVRVAVNTAYAASKSDMYDEDKTDLWWLRSPGIDQDYAAVVGDLGTVSEEGYDVDRGDLAARPALRLNLTSNLWSYAGTVSAKK